MVPTRPDPVMSGPRRVGVSRSRRRPRTRRFRRFWTAPIPDGGYARIPTWGSRERWIAAVTEHAAQQPTWTRKRRTTFVSVARALAEHADGATGRGVSIANATLARNLNVEVRTVQRHLHDLGASGLVVTVDEGRHLTRDERITAYEATERVLIRKAATRALTLPRTAVTCTKRNVAPPTASAVGIDVAFGDLTNARRARARKPASKPREPRSLPLQRLAAQIVQRLGWLARTTHIGALCDVLQRCGIDPLVWSAHDVISAIDGWHTRCRRTSVAAQATNRLGWFTWALREALADGYVPGSVRRTAARAERARRQALSEAQQREWEMAPRVDPSSCPAAIRAVRIALDASAHARAVRAARAASPRLP